jgi:hypothetical protein
VFLSCFSLKKKEGVEKFAGHQKIKEAFHSPQTPFIKGSPAFAAGKDGVFRLALL